MIIAGLGTAAPQRRFSQSECWEALQNSPSFPQLNQRSRAILRKVLSSRNGISFRHLCFEDLQEVFELTPDALHRRFSRHGPELASAAAERALADSGLKPEQIDAVLVSTCTGYLCPGLTSYVIERLKLRPDILGLDLVGQGCGAALPNLRTAAALLDSGGYERVLSVCVEVCSAAFYLDDDPGVLISACLFGDGAGAMVLARNALPKRKLEWQAGFSLHATADRELLRFEQRGGMLRNVLSPEVPRLAARHSLALLQGALARVGLERGQINAWLFHPGGRDVLACLRQELQLSDEQLKCSSTVLEQYGNLSSASLFFVLQEALRTQAPGGYWWMGAFGAGFSAHGALWLVQ